MSKETQLQDVSVLTTSKNGLVHLTPNDWVLIADKATRMTFKSGDPIISKGKRTHGVFLLVKGAASVQIGSQGTNPTIHAGEVLGEISFLDDLPATANVVAQQAAEAFYLDRPTLQTLFELFPHMGSRFYRSLAAILSRRMREMISSIPSLKKE